MIIHLELSYWLLDMLYCTFVFTPSESHVFLCRSPSPKHTNKKIRSYWLLNILFCKFVLHYQNHMFVCVAPPPHTPKHTNEKIRTINSWTILFLSADFKGLQVPLTWHTFRRLVSLFHWSPKLWDPVSLVFIHTNIEWNHANDLD